TTMKAAHRFSAISSMEGNKVLSRDGRRLAARVGNRVRICHVDDAGKERLEYIPLPDRRADALLFVGPDRLLTLRHEGRGRGVEVFDLKTNKLVLALPLPGGCIGEFAVVSPDGQLLIVPQNEQLLVQELREDAPPGARVLPKPRRPQVGLRCS